MTPPFAGYVSGHSTYSRAAAEVLTLLTGDEYFPGGVGEFVAEQNEFLVFEEGPSVDVILQWATYYDASDQTSLSRIWGGIHPPADDIPGRWIGMQVGKDAFAHAEKYFQGLITSVNYLEEDHEVKLYPNPTNGSVQIEVPGKLVGEVFTVVDPRGKEVTRFAASGRNQLDLSDLNPGLYILNCSSNRNVASLRFVIY